jgi:hypothetical protein
MERASVCSEDGQFLSMNGMYLPVGIEFSMMLPSYHAALILLMYQVYPLLFESLCSLPGIVIQ